jgi:hypothetical protein
MVGHSKDTVCKPELLETLLPNVAVFWGWRTMASAASITVSGNQGNACIPSLLLGG